MPYKITPHQLTETIDLIAANASRQFKENLANYHDSVHPSYRDIMHCNRRFESCFDQGIDRLQGLNFLFLDHTKAVREIKKAQDSITEDRALFVALLKAGKHFNDQLLTSAKEVV